MYQNMQRFPLTQALTQAQIQQQNIANQYAPQINQANIAQTNSAAALNTANANSPSINPVASGSAIYNAYANAVKSGNPQQAAFWAAKLNQQTTAPMNMMGMPAGPAAGPYNTNPGAYPSVQMSQAPANTNATGGAPNFQAGQAYSAPSQGYMQSSPTGQLGGQNAFLNMLSNYKTRGMQQATQDPNNPNNVVTTSAPTTATQDVNQVRALSATEAQKLLPTISSGVLPYNNEYSGNIRLGVDSLLAEFGNQGATQRLQDYMTARSLMPSYGGDLAKMAGYTKPGVELEKTYAEAQFPNLAEYGVKWIPANISTNALQPGLTADINAQNSAQQLAAQNFPVSTPRSQVGWAGGVAGSNAPGQASAPQGQSQQAQAFPTPPTFENASEARGWFKSLSPSQQTAYLNTLPKGRK